VTAGGPRAGVDAIVMATHMQAVGQPPASRR
jgi:hypothetical protein